MTEQRSCQHLAEMREVRRSRVRYKLGRPGAKGKRFRIILVAQLRDVSVSLSLLFAVQCTAQFDLQLLRRAKQPAPLCILGG